MNSKQKLEQALNAAEHRYRERTVKSKAFCEKAEKYLPGGDTRQACHFHPYPTFIECGNRSHLYDVDGNEYIDLLNNYTQQIHGHSHPETKEAVLKQMMKGTIFASPHEAQIELAKLLCERVPSFNKVRFCNSGTEATMFAIKGARAYTGKDKIIKMEGVYHGTHDLAEGSVFPPLSDVGDPLEPNVVPGNAGIPANVFDNLIVVQYNKIEALENVVKKYKNELAAVIIEPVMCAGGVIPADLDYLQAVRKITQDNDLVLIFDEVVSFRLSPGGAQELFGVIPDLTTLGKFIGGGFPIGAFGGKDEIMDVFSPSTNIYSSGGKKVKHSGTFNGHPVVMKAGLATMNSLTPEAYEQINNLGAKLRVALNEKVFAANGIRAKTTGVGSLAYIHYTLEDLKNYRQIKKAMDAVENLFVLVHLESLNHGIWIAERGEIAISTPMDNALIDNIVGIYSSIFRKIKPDLEKDFSHLII